MSIDFASTINLMQSGVSRFSGSAGFKKPYQPSFSAHGTAGLNPGANSYVIYGVVDHNVGGHYNAANGLFTAPAAGLYYFFGHLLLENGAVAENRTTLRMNGGWYTGGVYIMYKVGSYHTAVAGQHMKLAAGDTVGVYREATIAQAHSNGDYYAFGGYLIG